MTAVDTVTCRICGLQAVEEFPHKHDTPPRPDHDPVGKRPPTLSLLLHEIRRQYYSELPTRLHVSYVPARTEPITVADDNAEMVPPYTDDPVLNKHTIEVLDVGELGAPSWSPQAHRRFGGVTGWGEAWTVSEADYAIFPWAYALERRLPGWCRRRHLTRPELYYEHHGSPLCQVVLRWVVVGTPFDEIGERLAMTPERTVELLESAAGFVWRCVSDSLNEIDMRRTA